MKISRVLLLTLVSLVALVALAPVALTFAPGDWLARPATALASRALGAPVAADALSLDLLGRSPSASFEGLEVRLPNEARTGNTAPGSNRSAGTIAEPGTGPDSDPVIGGLDGSVALDGGALFGGELRFESIDVVGGAVNLRRDAEGDVNLVKLLTDGGVGSDPTASSGASGVAIPPIERLSIDRLAIDYRDARTGLSADARLDGQGSTVDPARPLRLDVDGGVATDAERVSLNVQARVAATADGSAPDDDGATQRLDVAVDADLGGIDIALDGALDASSPLDGLRVEVAVAGASLRPFEALSGAALPAVPRYRLAGSVLLDGSEIVLRRFDGTIGDSRFDGDLRVDVAPVPLTLYANVIFSRLDLDEALAIAVGDGVETSRADERDRNVISGADGWFPDRPLELDTIAALFDGSLRVRAERIESRWPLGGASLEVTLGADRIDVDPLTIELAGGEVAGELGIDTAGTVPEGEVELRLRRIRLVELLEAVGVDDDSVGTLGGRARYWFAGDDIDRIAGSADGGSFLLMTGGKLDSLLAELFGIDLVESAVLLLDPGKTLTRIDCAYLDVLVERGLLDVNRLLFETADTLIVGDGQVDLGRETFDLSFEPHPKDPSLVEAGSPVTISSDGNGFSVAASPELYAGVALATLLGTVAAPAAALLPLIEAGEEAGAALCNGLIESLDEAR